MDLKLTYKVSHIGRSKIEMMQKTHQHINYENTKFFRDFKDDLYKKAETLGIQNNKETTELLQYMYDYPCIEFSLDDFTKSHRSKNHILNENRCCANKSNNLQCTRKRKTDKTMFCGTHIKGTPHGVVSHEHITEADLIPSTVRPLQRLEINGIMCNVDNCGHVYVHEDVVRNVKKPRIFSKYCLDDNGNPQLINA